MSAPRSAPDTPVQVVPLLEARGLSVGYGATPVVRELDLKVMPGEVVALLGSNGAGKTTTLLGLAGELAPSRGEVLLGGTRLDGSLHSRSRQGLGYVTEERSVIFSLSVYDNLRLGRGDIDMAFELFPELKPLRRRRAGTLSGGEQQILTFARALSRRPRVLIADELSLGLAPLVVRRLVGAIRDVAATGVGVLLVEQQVQTALRASERAYVLKRGQVVLTGASPDLLNQIDDIERSYIAD
ncbi:MAG TPA: ABC transporter ATP-binding protein [Jatrophihabitantaceae bacterium]|nr:ABC transporter ATP-binding protein [Jatrophihabitantaceae bacterium]